MNSEWNWLTGIIRLHRGSSACHERTKTAKGCATRPNKSGSTPAREKRAADDIKKETGVEPKLVPVRPLGGNTGSNTGGTTQEINLPPGQRLQTFGSGSVVFVNGGFGFLVTGQGQQEP